MKYCIIDLEFEQPTNDLLEIGAVILDINNNNLLKKNIDMVCFQRYVSLPDNKNPSEYITELCKIDHDRYNLEKVPPKEALEDFWHFFSTQGSGGRIAAWGDDSDWIVNFSNEFGVMTPKRLRKLDLKMAIEPIRFFLSKKAKGGLLSTLNVFGLDFVGQQHSALWDAHNTAILYAKVLRNYKNGIYARKVFLED